VNLGNPDDPAGQLGLTNAELGTIKAGTLNVGDARTGTITVNTAVSLANVAALNLTTSAAASVVFNGPLAVTGTSKTVTITTGGARSRGGATADVPATSLAVTASTGIGSGAAPLTTSVANLEARTATGGITISNSGGTLHVGGVSDALDGVRATTSG